MNNGPEPVQVDIDTSVEQLQRQDQWTFMSLHGIHEAAAEWRDGKLALVANTTRSGAMSRNWLPPTGWEVALTLHGLSLTETSLILCFYSGIEYLPHSYENRIEFELTDHSVRIFASRRQFFERQMPRKLPARVRVFCSMEGELTLLIDDKPVYSFDQQILVQGAELLLYAGGTGVASVSNIEFEHAIDPWTMAHPDTVPRDEFPNPQFQRDTWWKSLNGTWELAFDPFEALNPELLGQIPLPRQIKVPFPWQSRLSGVYEPAYMGRVWYRRSFNVPEEATEHNERVHLHFVAVDYETHVWVNNHYLGEHKGGYSPFCFDITDYIKAEENVLLVSVIDPRDTSRIPIGKQGTWYTRSSGIWQSVYLQSVPAVYIDDVRMITDIDNSRVLVDGAIVNASSTQKVNAIASFGARTVAVSDLTVEGDRFHGEIAIPDQQLWSPDHPYLYDLVLLLNPAEDGTASDALRTYFGMRKVSHEGRRLLLNNKPIYIFGALNQAFHPDGLYNYPDAETIRNDVVQAKSLGLNCFRVHIKVDDPLLYYWMDKLGILAWQDLPCIDDRGYQASTYEENMSLNFPEGSAKHQIVRDSKWMIHELRNHPCILIWAIMNEGWGIGGMHKEMDCDFDRSEERQTFVRRMYDYYHELDSTRYVVDNSPCEMGYSHVKTDILEYHFYANHIAHAKLMTYEEEYGPWRGMIRGIGTREQLNHWFAPTVHHLLTDDDYNRPIIISEFGPWPGMPWHEQDISVFIKFLTHEIMLNPEICGFIMTEYQDIEWERNGLVQYDRKPKRVGFDMSKIVFNPIVPLLDCPPFIRHMGGDSLEIPLYLSNYGRRDLREIEIEMELRGVNPFGFTTPVGNRERIRVENVGYGLHQQQNVRIPITNEYPLYRYYLNCANDNLTYGKNVIFIENYAGLQAAKEDPAAVNLEQFLVESEHVEEFRLDNRLEALGFYGSGRMILWLPENTCPKALIMEISSCPPQLFSMNKHVEPAVVEVYFNETKIHEFVAPPAKADFDGYLSQINSYRWGIYGELVTIMLSVKQWQINTTNRLILRTPSNQGLLIYSNRTGRYPTTPIMMF